MSMVISYAVGNGDMFSIRHNSDSFTIIDSNISEDNKNWIIEELKRQGKGKGIHRFISTHPDQDHINGLKKLYEEISIYNFYCVSNNATKDDETEDFKYYCQLRDGNESFKIDKGCKRKWLNLDDDEREGAAGIEILWPDVENEDYKAALADASEGESPNNISPIITYSIENNATFVWLGDLETAFMKKNEDEVEWPEVDILFAPHHGRESGKIPQSILEKMNPKIVIIGEAPSQQLNYYSSYDTITQNSAGTIAFECEGNHVHVYVERGNYEVDFLTNKGATTYKNYIGSLII